MDAKLFWENIKKVLSEQGKTFVWLCEQAGVSVQVMKNRIYKERIPDVEDTLKLMAVLGTTVEEFFGVDIQLPPKVVVECAADTEKIPVFEQFFSCGKGQYVPETEYINGYIAIPEDLKTKRFEGHLAASKIRGDSMEPTIFNGDTVICDDLGVRIISDNQAYEAMFAKNDTEELKIIGKVHYVLHKV